MTGMMWRNTLNLKKRRDLAKYSCQSLWLDLSSQNENQRLQPRGGYNVVISHNASASGRYGELYSRTSEAFGLDPIAFTWQRAVGSRKKVDLIGCKAHEDFPRWVLVGGTACGPASSKHRLHGGMEEGTSLDTYISRHLSGIFTLAGG
jgi:hypothetical protein